MKFEHENDNITAKYIRKFHFPENTCKIKLKCSEFGGVQAPLAFINEPEEEVIGEDVLDAPDGPDQIGGTPSGSSNSKLETASHVAKLAQYGTGAVKNIADLFFML